jgi:hypothetical protein
MPTIERELGAFITNVLYKRFNILHLFSKKPKKPIFLLFENFGNTKKKVTKKTPDDLLYY